MKTNFSIFTTYLFFLVLIKILYSITFLNISYSKVFESENIDKIARLDLENNGLEWLFLTLIFVLMAYLFSSSKKNVIISGHTKYVLYAAGLIGIYSQLQRKHFFGLLDFLHM